MDTPEKPPPEPEAEHRPALEERGQDAANAAVAALASAALGAAVGGPAGVIAGATFGPLLEQVLDFIGERVRIGRKGRAARVIAAAAAKAGVAPLDLATAAMNDPAKLLLAGEVIEAAMRSAVDVKLAALADALARGVTESETSLDRELVFVRALADIEAAHLRVLKKMVTEDSWGYPARPANLARGSLPGWSDWKLREKFPKLAELLSAILATLQRHALIEVVPVDWVKETNRALTGWSHNDEREWRGTELGEWFLERVEQAAASTALPSAAPEGD